LPDPNLHIRSGHDLHNRLATKVAKHPKGEAQQGSGGFVVDALLERHDRPNDDASEGVQREVHRPDVPIDRAVFNNAAEQRSLFILIIYR